MKKKTTRTCPALDKALDHLLGKTGLKSTDILMSVPSDGPPPEEKPVDRDWLKAKVRLPQPKGLGTVILPSTDDTIATLRAELARLRAALAGRDAWIAGAVALLRRIQWYGDEMGIWCPSCRGVGACDSLGNFGGTHDADCPLKAALDTAPEPTP